MIRKILNILGIGNTLTELEKKLLEIEQNTSDSRDRLDKLRTFDGEDRWLDKTVDCIKECIDD